MLAQEMKVYVLGGLKMQRTFRGNTAGAGLYITVGEGLRTQMLGGG